MPFVLFPTVTFAVFLAVVLTLNAVLIGRTRAWTWTMLGASYVFYGWWDLRFLGLVAGVSLVSWAAGREITGRHTPAGASRRWVVTAVTLDLFVLGFFKYYGFFAESLAGALQPVGIAPPLPLLRIVLPVGISFFTFQAISYVVDLHRGESEPASLPEVALYLAFFPQLVAGPIVRAREFLPQLRDQGARRRVDVAGAVPLIIAGLFKKVVVASYVARTLVDPVFSMPASHTGPEVLLGIYGYAVQIYADFSGYTDIAIGVALLLGFRFPTNFDAPYAARSLQDFWRRWHITLSTWLRDYLYVPLGGNRGGELLTYRNLMLTMVLGGLWHGAAWTFLAWGALHGGWLALERALLRAEDGVVRWPGGPVVGWLVTFHVVCLGWVVFRADSLATAAAVLARLGTGWAAVPAPAVGVAAVVVAMLATQLVGDRPRAAVGLAVRRTTPALAVAGGALGLVVIDVLGPQGVAPFIYFQF